MNESSPRPLQRLLSGLNHVRLWMLKMFPRDKLVTERADHAGASQSESRHRGFEVTDVHNARITQFCFGLLVLVVLSMIGVAVIYNKRLKAQTNSYGEGFQGGASQRTPIGESWQALDAETAMHLDGYRWIDKSRGVVQVPLDRAMDLVREKEVQP